MSRGRPSQTRSPAGGVPVRDRLAERERAALLVEFYGPLLTSRQQELLTLYLAEDLSLSEIASRDGVSRQAVHDLLRRSVRAMESFEDRLGFMTRFRQRQEDIERLAALLRSWGPILAQTAAISVAEAEALVERLGED